MQEVKTAARAMSRGVAQRALCRHHADRADSDTFTTYQLQTMKANGRSTANAIRGRFDWMRRDLLVTVGSMFFYRVPCIVQIGLRRCVWFTRDEDDYLLLNFEMPSASDDSRASLRENAWVVPPDVRDLECPPSGRRIRVRYADGDQLQIQFFDLPTPEKLRSRYPEARTERWDHAVEFPVTGVEVWERAAGTLIEFSPTKTNLPFGTIKHGLVSGSSVGFQVNLPPAVGSGRAAVRVHGRGGIEVNLQPWMMTEAMTRLARRLSREPE